MTESDAMRLLAAANPVRAEDLAPLDLPSLRHRQMPSRRLVLALAIVGLASAASLIGILAFGGTSSHPRASSRSGMNGMNDGLPPVTLARPLAPGAKEVALADATATFGPALVLPDTSFVGPSDVGPVWMYSNSDKTVVTVAVTFPKQGIFIQYTRPYPGPGVSSGFDVRAHYAAIARENSYFHVLDLNGFPALAADQNSDETGHNFGVVLFAVSGIEIRVFGHYDQATLVGVAHSIVDRSAAPSPSIFAGPGSPPTPVADSAAADALLPFTVVLPSDATPTSLGVLEQSHQLDAYFDTPASGPYNLVEGPTDETVAMLPQTAKRWTVGPIHEIDVVDGVDVLIQGSSDGSLVASWLRLDGGSKILTWVKGPDTAERGQVEGTFTKQQALAVAADIIAQGG